LLDERIPFLKLPVLGPQQEEDFNVPAISSETATLFELCVRVLEHGYRLGPHDLPLMGTGDWNDGMNKARTAVASPVAHFWECLALTRQACGHPGPDRQDQARRPADDLLGHAAP
jgi:cellobiose phosphorylase